jgi:L-Ala-D/L-Glu epimerase
MKLWLEKIHLDLKVNWKLSRNQTTFKENFIVHLRVNGKQFRSEIAPNIRYGETPASIQEQFEAWLALADLARIQDEKSLTDELDKLPLLHALRFGLESTFLAWLAASEGQALFTYLKLPTPHHLMTSFSMPIIPVGEIQDYLRPLGRFKSLKIKVSADSAVDMLSEITKYTQASLRVDANEGWSDLDAFKRFEETLKGKNIELIEQPFPASMQGAYRELRKTTSYILLADESIEDVGNFPELKKQFHAVNIKLMKTGSLLKARDFLVEAKTHGLRSMIGCMIESTIGISYGMLFGGLVDYVDLDGFLLIKDEPFHLVKEEEGILRLV